jgi:hypothetical protein
MVDHEHMPDRIRIGNEISFRAKEYNTSVLGGGNHAVERRACQLRKDSDPWKTACAWRYRQCGLL